MTERAQELLRDVLALPNEERATVAAELLASLDESVTDDAAAVQAAWAREVERRARRGLSGGSLA
jgi:3-deoxy-D-arabino-heptulosonate 7-phosphate (DAHP) synthase